MTHYHNYGGFFFQNYKMKGGTLGGNTPMIFTISYLELLISSPGLCCPDISSLERCGPAAHPPQRASAIFHSFSYPKQWKECLLPSRLTLAPIGEQTKGGYTPMDGVALGSDQSTHLSSGGSSHLST